MYKVVLVKIDNDLPSDDFERLIKFVSPEKQKYIRKFRFQKDSQNSLLGDIIARIEVSKQLGISIEDIEFSANTHGKPFLTNTSGFHFNVSHAGSYVVLATDTATIGVDVEVIHDIDLGIAEKFFSADEKEYVFSAQEQDRASRFFEVWTMKESYIKRNGKGLSIALPEFSVFDPAQNLKYHRVYYSSDIVIHVCTQKAQPPAFQSISIQDCLNILFKN